MVAAPNATATVRTTVRSTKGEMRAIIRAMLPHGNGGVSEAGTSTPHTLLGLPSAYGDIGRGRFV